jgi:SPP1 gp7 family putative phage head morphogenesis protein
MPTTPQPLIDIATRHNVYLQRYAAHEVKQIAAFLEQMDDAVRKALGGKDITDYTRRRLETLVTSIGEDLTAITGELKTQTLAQAVELAQYETGFEIRSLNQVVDYDFARPTAAQTRAAVLLNPLTIPDSRYGGMILDAFITDAMRPGVERVTAAIRSGYYQGQTTNQILQVVRGTRAAQYTDGIWPNVGRDAETVVRTSLQHAATQARESVWAANSDIIRGVEWVATLEVSTCNVCGGLDGQVYPMDKGPRPPIHPNCRCATVARLDDRYKFLDEGATRFSRGPDGVERVDAKETYFSWLKKQPKDFVDTAIGPTRAKLLLDGGLSAQQFAELQLGRRFEPLNLAQMRELDPVAFARAGIDE